MTARRFFGSTVKTATAGPPTINLTGFFSVRQLSGYSGSCLRVIRDSDLTTLDIGFVSGLLDTASIATFCSGTTGRVDRWYNQFDGSFGSQATQANRPTIYTGGAVVTVNGKPALAFDVNDQLGLSSPKVWTSIFTTLKIDTLSPINYWGNTVGNSPTFFAGGSAAGVNGFGIVSGGIYRIQNTSENTNQNQHTLISYTNYLAVDTNSSDFVSNTYNLTKGNFSIIGFSSNSFGLNGKLQEILIYSDDKTSDKASIESEIQTFYGI